MKGHWSRGNPVKLEALLKDLHATTVLSFPNANEKKVYFNPYIYAKVIKTLKSGKNQNEFQFLRHVTSVFHWQIFATVFLCFIAGECHGYM